MSSFFPVVIDTGKLDKPHQDHKPHVGLKLFNSDLGPAGKFFGSHTLKSKSVTLLNDVHQESWCEEGKDAYRGGRVGTFGPGVPVNDGMLIDSSDDDHCTFSLHV